MKLAAKLALGSCVVAVGVCGVLAYIAADDERRDFVKGSTRAVSVLPEDVLVVDVEVDDEYEDTDDEAERSDMVQLAKVQPIVMQSPLEASGCADSKGARPRRPTPPVLQTYSAKANSKGEQLRRPETVDDNTDADAPERVLSECGTHWSATRPRVSDATCSNNNAIDACA